MSTDDTRAIAGEVAAEEVEYTSSVERLRTEYVEMREQHFGFADLYAAEWDRIMAAHDARVRAEDAAEIERISQMNADWALAYREAQDRAEDWQRKFFAKVKDADRLAAGVWELVDTVERQVRHGHAVGAAVFADDLRALLARADDEVRP